MLRSIWQIFLQNRIVNSEPSYVCHLQAKRFLNAIAKSTSKQSPTVSYLVNSCGLSSEQAVSVSKKVRIKDTKRPNSVLELFSSYGFAKSQISRLTFLRPRLILADPEVILRPKIEYFQSLGIVGPDLPKFICSDCLVLVASLKNRIIPSCDFLRGFLKTNDNVVRALKNPSCVARYNIEKMMMPNITTLRVHRVPECHIARLMILQPQTLMLRDYLFKEVVLEILDMGFRPTSQSFILAVRSMIMRSREKWEKKTEILKSFGWSQDEVFAAFRVQPMLMVCSEKKIEEMLDFLVNKAGLNPSDVARCPNLFLTSLERRIIPRCTLLQILTEKGMFKKDSGIIWALNSSKESFEKKFVTQYEDHVPEVIKAYQSKMGSKNSIIELKT